MRIGKGFLAVMAIAAVLTLSGSPGLSQQGRDFSGYYDLTDVVDLGDDVALTFTVEVFNHGAIDAYDATLIIEDPLDPIEDYGDVWIGYVDTHDRTSTSGDVVVPAWRYEQWVEGNPPRVRIEFGDAGGFGHAANVEMIRMPILEEGS